MTFFLGAKKLNKKPWISNKIAILVANLLTFLPLAAQDNALNNLSTNSLNGNSLDADLNALDNAATNATAKNKANRANNANLNNLGSLNSNPLNNTLSNNARGAANMPANNSTMALPNNSGTKANSLGTPNGSQVNSSAVPAPNALPQGNSLPANVPPQNAAPLNASGGSKTNYTNNAVPSGNVAPAPINAAPAASVPAANTVNSRASVGTAPMSEPPDSEQLSFNSSMESSLRSRLIGDLQKYCLDYCSILSLSVQSSESFDAANADLGFESTTVGPSTRRFSANAANAEIMVDTRFGASNIERMQKVFEKLLMTYPIKLQVQWSQVTFPDSAIVAKSESQVRNDFAQQVKIQLERIVAEFCPRDCKINHVDVSVERAGVDEITSGSAYRFLFTRDVKGSLNVKGVTASVTLNSTMDPERKGRIRSLMNEVLLPFGIVQLKVSEIPFPKSAELIDKEAEIERGDPWGLKRLGEALKVFREFANTKEIIKEKETSQSNSEQTSSETASSASKETEKALESQLEKSSLEKSALEKENQRQLTDKMLEKSSNNNLEKSTSSSSELEKSEGQNQEFWTQERIYLFGGLLLAIILAAAVGLRYVVTGKRMQEIISEGSRSSPIGAAGGSLSGIMGENAASGVATAGIPGVVSLAGNPAVFGGMVGAGAAVSEEAKQRIELQSLREEIIQCFITQPKVARDVISRIIREDGIEKSSKYLCIFGEMLFLDLMGDADLKKEVYTIAEFVHVNAPSVEFAEQLLLLRELKIKVTAAKLRGMTSRSLDMFDFLKGKSASQIFELIRDESAKSQAIVLTQMPTEARRGVFELFEGQQKFDLLRELSNSNVIQREYLDNVAEALKRKAVTRPSFDGESVQGADVLFDLLEKAELSDQRALMQELDRNSPEVARMLRSRLITVETLPYLRDGLLLEIFLNMDTATMSTFMAGVRDHIRRMILSKAPSEIAENWIESLENIKSIDAESFKLAELQVISKVRGFANQGLINLIDINMSLYPKGDAELFDENMQREKADQKVFRISNPLVA